MIRGFFLSKMTIERKKMMKNYFLPLCLKFESQKEEDDTQEHTSKTRMSAVKNETKSEMA